MNVTVAYASPTQQTELALELPQGACVGDAVRLAVQHPSFDGLDLDSLAVGVFNQVVNKPDLDTHGLRDGDRVEFYRALLVDPMTARRQRAERQNDRVS